MGKKYLALQAVKTKSALEVELTGWCLHWLTIMSLAWLAITAMWYLIPTSAFAEEVNHAQTFQVTLEDVESAVAQALVKEGVADHVKATLIEQRARVLYQYPKPLALEVKTLRFDSRAKRWNANLMFESDGQVISALPVAGRFDELVEVPVLKQRLIFGNIIEDGDIDHAEITASQLRKDYVQNEADMIGKTPEHSISPGRPIYAHELTAPVVLKKGKSVTMRFSTPRMDLRTNGEAMDDGAVGETVRVKNEESKKIVHAVVEGPETVRITPEG
jgi:flagella basal body P-ring formation protein FlgA